MNELADRLQGYLADRYSGARVSDFHFLLHGFESDIYTFVFHPAGEGPRLLILRVYPGDGVIEKQQREVNGLRWLYRAGFPVPAFFCYETNPTYLGRPFTIMERIEGRLLRPLLDQVAPSRARDLIDQFSALLARLHQLEWRLFTDQAARHESNPAAWLDDTIDHLHQLYVKYNLPGFTKILGWLEFHKAGLDMQLVVAHLDYHASNVILRGDGSMAVIDWSRVGIADYRADLSWTMMIMGDYGQPYWREQILRAYSLHSGKSIEDLDYFNILTDLKSLTDTVISLKASPKALGLNPARAETVEQEAPNIQRLLRRIRDITGIEIPEAKELLTF